MEKTARQLALGALIVLALVTFMIGQGHKIPASKCSLPVDSTIVLEYPQGSAQTTVELKSDPNNVPTVNTNSQNSDKTLDAKFTSLAQTGTINGQTITANLNPNVPSTGKVTSVQQSSSGDFAKGHHTFNLFLQYTVGGQTFENKTPIKVEADIDSTSPSGRTYLMTNGPVQLYDSSNKSKVVATLYKLENRVQAAP